jgi:hypothetical protein
MSFADIALGAVLGAVSAIAGTLIGTYANHYFAEREEDRRTKNEEWKLVVDEVYSPLLFDFMRLRKGILLWLDSIGKTLKISSGQIPENEFAVSSTLVAKLLSRRKESKLLEEALRKRYRLIKPSNLRFDLYLFHSYFEEIEDHIFFISTGRFEKSPHELLQIIEGCANMASRLEEAASYLRVEIGKLVVSTKGVPQQLTYKPFFTEDIIKEMEDQHESMLRVYATPR